MENVTRKFQSVLETLNFCSWWVCASHPLFVYTPSFLLGGKPPTKFSKNMGELDSISIFRGRLLGKRGLVFFRGLQFLHKKQTKI